MAHSGARRSLSTRQLAAIRLLARGHGSVRTAKHLGLNRHTIARWKQDPLFAAELDRLLALLTEKALALHPGGRTHAFLTFVAQSSIQNPQSKIQNDPL